MLWLSAGLWLQQLSRRGRSPRGSWRWLSSTSSSLLSPLCWWRARTPRRGCWPTPRRTPSTAAAQVPDRRGALLLMIDRPRKTVLKIFFMCVGGGMGGGSATSSLLPVPVVYQPPPWVQMTTTAPPSQVAKGPEEWALPQQVNLGKTHSHTHTSADFY